MSQTGLGLTVGETYTLSFDWAATQYQFVNGSSFGCTGCWTGATTNQFQVSLGGDTRTPKRWFLSRRRASPAG